MTKAVYCKKEPYDVLIDRSTSFGNPFQIGRDGNRADVIRKHQEWLLNPQHIMIDAYSNKWVRENVHKLKGKVLGCWCKPKGCHGDFLAFLAEVKL